MYVPHKHILPLVVISAACLFLLVSPSSAFEGRMEAVSTRGGQSLALLYTVGTDALRIEVTGSDRPNPVDVLDRNSGELTLHFPHNRSFVRLKAASKAPATPPGFPALPPGIGPQSPPISAGPSVGIGPTNFPAIVGLPSMPAMPPMPQASADMGPGMPGGMSGMPAASAMPMMPMMSMPGEAMELTATGEKTTLLGFACEQFEIKQRGELMTIWATRQLLPFQPYIRNQPSRFGPQRIEERWADLLAAEQLFPLRVGLRLENGPERLHFEVLSVTAEKLTQEEDSLFRPPEGYFETRPFPF